MNANPIYQAHLDSWEQDRQGCGHRHRKAVHALRCLKGLYPGQKAHLAVSEDGGFSWQRIAREELRLTQHLWEEQARRRSQGPQRRGR